METRSNEGGRLPTPQQGPPAMKDFISTPLLQEDQGKEENPNSNYKWQAEGDNSETIPGFNNPRALARKAACPARSGDGQDAASPLRLVGSFRGKQQGICHLLVP